MYNVKYLAKLSFLENYRRGRAKKILLLYVRKSEVLEGINCVFA